MLGECGIIGVMNEKNVGKNDKRDIDALLNIIEIMGEEGLLPDKHADFDEWLEEGYVRGWIGPPICETHDGLPMSDKELQEFDEGGDPCIHILRLYEDKEAKDSVECSHGPSIWRATNISLGEPKEVI